VDPNPVEISDFVKVRNWIKWLAVDPHPLLPRTADRLVGLARRNTSADMKAAPPAASAMVIARFAAFAFQLGRTGIGVPLLAREIP